MKKIITIIAAIIAGAIIMYSAIYFFPQRFSTIVTKTEESIIVTDNGIADAVDKVYDAVVVVSTYNKGVLKSTGTGFVYSVEGNDAYILTNHHVIDNGDNIKVTFTNGKIYDTKVVGSNSIEDVAVLSLSNKDFDVASIGKAEDLRVGDTLFAVGAPLDSAFNWTVTRGILSGKDRLVEVNGDNGEYIMSVIQTDTAINNGNSGGPLCNSNGEVIGINTLKLNTTGVEGMGFAIPIEHAIDTANNIREGKKVKSPYLGVSIIDIRIAYESKYKEEYGKYVDVIDKFNLSGGMIIDTVEKGLDAAKAGLKKGDVITKVNGENVVTASYFRYELYKNEIGDEIEITYIRDMKLHTVKIKLASVKPE